MGWRSGGWERKGMENGEGIWRGNMEMEYGDGI